MSSSGSNFSDPLSAMSLRANSPSPRRNRMNLIEEYSEYDTDVTNGSPSRLNESSNSKAHPFLNKSPREIELAFSSDD